MPMRHKKYRLTEDARYWIRYHYAHVMKLIAPCCTNLPVLEICAADGMASIYRYTHDATNPVIRVRHTTDSDVYLEAIYRGVARYICHTSKPNIFGNSPVNDSIVFSCVMVVLAFMHSNMYPDGALNSLSVQHVRSEKVDALSAFRGLEFVEAFLNVCFLRNKSVLSYLNIRDICETALHAKAIYIGSLDIDLNTGYLDPDTGRTEKMNSAVKSALSQRLDRAIRNRSITAECSV